MLQHARTWKAIALAGAWLLPAAFICLLLLAAAMHKGLNHDENMYVSGGVLLGRQGLWPYTGFSFFQMPYLEFLYGALFGLSQAGDLLLWARLVNFVAATLSCMVLAWTGWTVGGGRWSVVSGVLTALCGPVILVCSPVFVYASGLAWNHDLPVLCTLVATVCFAAAAGREKRSGLLVAAAVLVGLATGFRLAFLPVLLPFFVGALLLPGQSSPRERVRCLALVAGGATAALLPALALFLRDPSAFVFANLRYHQVNELYWQQLGYERAMTWAGKAQYLWGLLLGDPANWSLVASLVFVLGLLGVMAVRRVPLNFFPFLFACSVALSLLVGAVIPSPTWLQYLYAPASVLVLALLYGTAALGGKRATEGLDQRRRTKDEGQTAASAPGQGGAPDGEGRGGRFPWALGILLLVAAASLVSGIPAYRQLNLSLDTATWVPVQVHAAGAQVGRLAGGNVMTLAPIFPLEGGARIYPQLASGPFAVRGSSLLTELERRGYNMETAQGLARLMQASPPSGILLGPEAVLEAPLEQYARDHSYRPVTLPGNLTLWLP